MGLEQKREFDLGWVDGAKRILEDEGLMLRTGEREFGGKTVPMLRISKNSIAEGSFSSTSFLVL